MCMYVLKVCVIACIGAQNVNLDKNIIGWQTEEHQIIYKSKLSDKQDECNLRWSHL